MRPEHADRVDRCHPAEPPRSARRTARPFTRHGFKTYCARSKLPTPWKARPRATPARRNDQIVHHYEAVQSGSSSTRGSRSSTPPSSRPSTPRPPRSIEMVAQIVGLSAVGGSPGMRRTSRLRISWPDAPAQLPIDEVLRQTQAVAREDAPKKKVGQHLKYDRAGARQPRHRGEGRRARHAPAGLRARDRTRPHDMASLALRHLGVKAITYEDVCGKGARRSASTRSRSPRLPSTPPKMRTSRCGCIRRSIRKWPTRKVCCACIATSRCRPRACCARWSATAC